MLLDECVPRRLRASLGPHTAVTVPEQGWSGIRDGRLLDLAAKDFGAFVTVDRGFAFQQNLATLPLAVILLQVRSNRLRDVLPWVGQLVETLDAGPQRRLVVIPPLKLHAD